MSLYKTDNAHDYDRVHVVFTDGTTTIIYVEKVSSIPAALVQLCEDNGWDTEELNYFIIQ